MAADVWEYFAQRQRECRELSVSSEELYFAEEEGSDGKRGQVWGQVDLSGEIDAFLSVREVVIVEGGYAHREEFGYFLVIDGAEIWGYERDPGHQEMPEHSHGREHARYPSEPVSFKGAVEFGWEGVTHALEFGIGDYNPLAPE